MLNALAVLSLLLAAIVPATAAAEPPPTFADRTAALGLTLGTDAACWFDFDNDGWTDLCASGVLWRNEKGAKFTRVGEFGLSVAADFDNDGYADLFSWSRRKLYRNEGGTGTFAEVPLPADLPASVSRGACWGDFDGDGFADLYVGGYEDWEKNATYPSLLLLNQKGRGFKLAATDARYRARGVTAADFDRDGDLDVYVSNYRLQPNLLLVNDGEGGLSDAASLHNAVATSGAFRGGHSIGAAWGDFDNDGQIDLFAGNFAHRDSRGDQPQSRFLRNPGPDGKYVFEDKGTCGVFYQESYASPAAGDFDNDGDLDLFFTTVYANASFGRKNYPVLFRNDGNWAFGDATAPAGLAQIGATYQAAWADFDNDGDLDLVTGGRLYVNQPGTGVQSRNRWLSVRLRGDGKRVNRSAVGAQVRIRRKDGRVLTRQVEAGTGEGNQNDLTLHFGLGGDDRSPALALEILWPDGTTQTVTRVSPNRRLTVTYRRR